MDNLLDVPYDDDATLRATTRGCDQPMIMDEAFKLLINDNERKVMKLLVNGDMEQAMVLQAYDNDKVKKSAKGLQNQVFNTNELVYLILMELPMRDLLLSQRINQTCQSIVKRSPSLQERLFFRPTDLLLRPGILQSLAQPDDDETHEASGDRTVPVNHLANPLIEHYLNTSLKHYNPPSPPESLIPDQFKFKFVVHANALNLPRHGSWTRMLFVQKLQQRPCTLDLDVHVHINRKYCLAQIQIELHRTLGEILSILDEVQEEPCSN